jgi:adenylate kinase family enzyme
VKNLQLVDDNTIFELVENALRYPDATSKTHIIFDGFPRNLTQAQRLDTLLNVSKVISVRSKDEDVIARQKALGQTEETVRKQLTQWRTENDPIIN